MIKSINAVLISSRDVKRLVEFYRDKVGIPLKVADHGGGMHAEAELGETHFAIFPGGGAPLERGPIMFSLHVDNIDAEYQAMSKRGVKFDGPPADRGFGGVIASFRDPDGNGVCLMCWQSERKK
ncbi:MAG: VOC family protein [Planctomycetes bacterium]|nr:VOC family protein [Planctomycetota bacterium]NUQ33462.1 VOC family protein [Planctomycetaceae bacterium]